MSKTIFSPDRHFLLLDGYGYVFRAYYALPPLKRRSDGFPVGAITGFCNMLFKIMIDNLNGKSLFEEPMPAFWAVAIDAPGETFRSQIYPQYKQNRKKTPEELIVQLPMIKKAVNALGALVLEKDGFEADDLMASFAKKAKQNKQPLTLISSDKDLMQLIGEKVFMYDPVKNKNVRIEQVYEKFGVTPDKVIDVQALAGDNSDNIPGVPGIGVKTAAQLINQYQTLENLFANINHIKQDKRRELLLKHKQDAFISKKLATLRDDIDIEIHSIEETRIKKPNMQKLAEFLHEMEFNTLTKRAADIFGNEFTKELDSLKKIQIVNNIDSQISEKEQKPTNRYYRVKKYITQIPFDKKNYRTIFNAKELENFLQQAEDCQVVALDVETNSIEPMNAKLLGISMACKIPHAIYIPIAHRTIQQQKYEQINLLEKNFEILEKIPKQIELDVVISMLQQFIEKTGVQIVGHNIKYDLLVLKNHGINIKNIHDTLLISYVLDAGRHQHNLNNLAKIHLQHENITYQEIVGNTKNKIDFAEVSIEKATEYAAEDADVTLRLYYLLSARMAAERKIEIYEMLERPIVQVLVDMESEGISIKAKELKKLEILFQSKIEIIKAQIYELAGEEFNIASPKQLAKILYEKLQIKSTKKTRGGQETTNAKILQQLCAKKYKIACEIIEWRHYSKLLSTYVKALPECINPKTNRVHTYYSLAATSTGRLSSIKPNLQNIPIRTIEGRMIREAFVAKPGYLFLGADYSQIELRILAHIAKVKTLQDAFAQGLDVHAMTAREIFNLPIEEKIDPVIRRKAKAINFGIIYGISAFGLAAQLEVSRQEAAEYLDMYLKRFDGITKYMDFIGKFIEKHEYVETIFARKCHFENNGKKNAVQKAATIRAAINAPIQGSASDITRRAMIKMYHAIDKYKINAKILLQVHDELIFEVSEEHVDKLKIITKDIMENATLPRLKLSVPLEVNLTVGKNWNQIH